MTDHQESLPSFKSRASGISGAWLAALGTCLLLTASAATAGEVLGTSKKSVKQILGDGQPQVSALFNEESSESHSGGIGSTHAYRTRVGYLGGRSCYAFFMKKTGAQFQPVEVFGLLYLCANRAEWGELEIGRTKAGFIYRASPAKGKGPTQTYLATLDRSARKLFVYSPEWRPDFDRELWITPDEAPVHREPARIPSKGELPRPAGSKQSNAPDPSLFGKPAPPSTAKQVWIDPKQVRPDPKQVRPSAKGVRANPKRVIPGGKQGIYLPKLDRVVPDGSSNSKAVQKKQKRKRTNKKRQKPTPPPPAVIGK